MLTLMLGRAAASAPAVVPSSGRTDWRQDVMKLITAVIRPENLDQVVRVVTGNGARGLTATEVLGFGRQHGHLATHQAAEGTDAELLPKVRLDIIVNDEDASILADAIVKSARTGKIGDGKLWIAPVESAVRVRTGERDAAAV
jgi:nitrogen regulatory protein P-II 1